MPIKIIEGAVHRLQINYGSDLEKMIDSIVLPESERKRILSVAGQHNQQKVKPSRFDIEIRDVNFTQKVTVPYAIQRIRRHRPDDHWQPVGLMEMLRYVQKFPNVYQNRVLYALGHVYRIGGKDFLISVTDNRGAIEFELSELRHNQEFGHAAVFPEFRIIG